MFGELCSKYPKQLVKVTGSGLIQAVHLTPAMAMFGGNHAGTASFLARCRQQGLGVINAGHTVKFTPHFELSSKEVGAIAEAFDRVCHSFAK